ncbi:hypothetical protein [Planomonospora alba]|uniref:hypothetical protein n=1 Tax=Planomonospora alba TaxID=161354 RepID=UPI0031E5E4BE
MRWSDAAAIPVLRDQPDLPDAWWRSLPLPTVLSVLGADRLAEIVTEVALEHWPAAAVGDVLPALYVLDPDEADEPCTAIALDRAGSWAGLLSLTGHDLRDQPFVQPRPLLTTLFSAVFARLSPVSAAPRPAAEERRAAVPQAPETPAGLEAPADLEAPEAPVGLEAPEASEDARPVAAPESGSADAEPEVPAPASTAPEAEAGPVAEAGRAAEIEAGRAAESTPEAVSDLPAPESGDEPARSLPEPRIAAEPGLPAAAGSGPDPLPGPRPPLPGTGPARGFDPWTRSLPDPLPDPLPAPRIETEPWAEAALRSEAAFQPEAVSAPDAGPGSPAADGPEAVREPEAAHEPDARPAPAPEPEPEPEPAREPEPEPARGPAGAGDAPEPVPASAGADAPAPRRPAPATLHELLDAAFADLEDLSWAVAQNRVFTDDPATVEALAKLFAVPAEVVREAEDDLRARLRDWLASDEAAPYRAHLAALRKTLGKAAPVERLIGAADWHPRELRSLDVPAWQFVLATLGDYYLVDDWLVDGDIAELRHRTRDLISSAERPPTVGRALELVSSLGIHPEVAKEWLENVPQLRILGAGESARRANGAAPRQAPDAGPGREPAPEPSREAAGEAAGRPAEAVTPRPLKDVSLTRRCFRQPDGRWWLRVDITAEHLSGAECPLPSGFAAYLGLAPGDSRTVTSMVGELTLRWRDRPALDSLVLLLHDVGAKEGSHLFLTLSEEGVLRARHLPAASPGTDPVARALRLVGYTAPGGTVEQAARVIATRIGMSGSADLPDLLARLRERGDRDLQSLLA